MISRVRTMLPVTLLALAAAGTVPYVLAQPKPMQPAQEAEALPLPLLQPTLSLRLYSPHQSDLYPQHESTWESYPLVIGAHLAVQMPKPSATPAVKPTQAPKEAETLPLHELRYAVFAAYGDPPQFEAHPFHSDRIDLYGKSAPGDVELLPGVNVPPDATRLRLEALAYFDGAPGQTSSTIEVPLSPYPGDSLYHRYRDGYLRRHLLDSGRGLSWLWLKEYEPGKDRKELLYHSRTFRAPGDHARVYVPWTYECEEPALGIKAGGPGKVLQPMSPISASQTVAAPAGNRCGPSVSAAADAVFGSNENPLLRGGLAMASFSLEYLADRNPRSLEYAWQLFKYVEASEWIDPYGNRTGFFLRSKWPGSSCQSTGRGYCFASTDELVGMVLGMYRLNEALTAAIASTVDPSSYREMQLRLRQLTQRLGTQLRGNYYFVVPPRPSSPDTAGQWLPQERQSGWSGTYMLQWFLTGGFHAITGNRYSPADDIDDGHPAWHRMRGLPWNGNDEDDRDTIKLLLDAELSALKRAIYAIQGIGVGMYYYGTQFSLCQRLVAHGIFSSEPHCAAAAVVAAYFGRILFGSDFSPSEVTQVRTLEEDFPWFNVPMVLHAFQLGMADTMREPEAVAEVKRAMASVVNGVLVEGGDYTSIDVDDLCEELGYAVIDGLICYLSHIEVREHVGAAAADHDYYAAAIAEVYSLHRAHESPDWRKRFRTAIDITLRAAPLEFFPGLPAGKRRTQDVAGLHAPNPDRKIGRAFVWEYPPRGRVQGGGDAGPSDEALQRLLTQEPPVDALSEGAGVGYLLPTALVRRTNPSSISVHNRLVAEDTNFPYLAACFTLPRLLAPSAPGNDAACDFRFPRRSADRFDSVARNDFHEDATEIQWGSYQSLSIDKATHPSYHPGSSSIVYGRHDLREQIRTYALVPEADRDYYRLENDAGYGMRVSVASPDMAMILYVDHLRAAPIDGSPGRAGISVPARGRHTIMVTSAGTTQYSLEVQSLPVVESREVTTRAATPVDFTLAGRDRESRTLAYSVLESPRHGILRGSAPNLTYVPDAGFSGQDQFTFKATSAIGDSNIATVGIVVTP